MKRSLIFATGVLVVALLHHSPGAAYVTSTYQLLGNLAEERGKLALRDLSAQLTAELQGVETPVAERIFLKLPERLRLVQSQPDGEALHVVREGTSGSVGDPVVGRGIDFLATLLMPRGGSDGDQVNRIVSLLQRAGIDTRVVALGIYGDDVRESAYIIGARAQEPEQAQLWIDRESYQPVRLVTYADENGTRVRHESRFLGYGSSTGGAWFPEVIEDYRNDELLRRARLDEVRTNGRLPESLFTLP